MPALFQKAKRLQEISNASPSFAAQEGEHLFGLPLEVRVVGEPHVDVPVALFAPGTVPDLGLGDFAVKARARIVFGFGTIRLSPRARNGDSRARS